MTQSNLTVWLVAVGFSTTFTVCSTIHGARKIRKQDWSKVPEQTLDWFLANWRKSFEVWSMWWIAEWPWSQVWGNKLHIGPSISYGNSTNVSVNLSEQ